MKKFAFLAFVLVLVFSCRSTPQEVEQPRAPTPQPVVAIPEEKFNLWVYAVGINEYDNNQIFPNLLFAANDANSILEVLKTQEGQAFESVNTLLISDGSSLKPTRENILSNFEFLQEAGPDDTIILYFALHRLIRDDIFYLMPSDAKYDEWEGTDLSSIISFGDIVKSLDMPGNKIIILDTHYPKTAVDLTSGTDIIVLGAATGDEQARESKEAGGGFLTVSIIEAFTMAGDNPELTLADIYDYVAKRVGDLSENKQNPVLNLPAGIDDIILGIR